MTDEYEKWDAMQSVQGISWWIYIWKMSRIWIDKMIYIITGAEKIQNNMEHNMEHFPEYCADNLN